MKIIANPPQPPFRDYRTGGDDGLPVTIPTSRPPLVESTIDAWLYATFSPNGSSTSAELGYDGSDLVLATATETLLTSEGTDIETLKYLRITARRKPDSTGAIAAQTIRICCRPSYSATVSNAEETFTITGHPFKNGQLIQVAAFSLPGNVSAATDYYIRDVTADAFKIATTLGGSAVNISSDGTLVRVIAWDMEIGRLNVAAAAAGADPECDFLELRCLTGHLNWSCQQDRPLTFKFGSSDVDLEIEVEASGSN